MCQAASSVLAEPIVSYSSHHGTCVLRVHALDDPTLYVEVLLTANDLWRMWCDTWQGPPPVAVADLPDIPELDILDFPGPPLPPL